MNNFAGTITFAGKVDTNKIQEKYLEIKSLESTYTTFFLFGKTKLETSEDLVKQAQEYGDLVFYDLSISTEDKMVMLNNDIDKDAHYELVTFESAELDFRNIVERFQDSFEAICVREAENSNKYGNTMIKVDFLY